MKLYRKYKKTFEPIDDYSTISIGSIVKVFSEKTNRFIDKVPYFVAGVMSDNIILESDGKRVNFSISNKTLTK